MMLRLWYDKPAGEWVQALRSEIDQAKRSSMNMEEFSRQLNERGISLPRNTEKTISFIYPGQRQTIRGQRLGDEYTKEALVDFFAVKQAGIAVNKYGIESYADLDRATQRLQDEQALLNKEYALLMDQNDQVREILAIMQKGQHSELRGLGIDSSAVSEEQLRGVIKDREGKMALISEKVKNIESERQALKEVGDGLDLSQEIRMEGETKELLL